MVLFKALIIYAIHISYFILLPMSKLLFFILIVTTLFGCTSSDEARKQSIQTDTLPAKKVDEKNSRTNKEVVDTSKYSRAFITSLKEIIGHEKFELKDSLLIINNDTSYFPSTPAIEKQQTYTGKKDKISVAIHVQRLNYTTIKYRIEIIEDGKSSHYEAGVADLNAGFFLAAEIDEDDITGNAYPAAEFSFNASDKCYTIIRIGFDKGKGMARLLKSCNQNIPDIILEDFPTLRLK